MGKRRKKNSRWNEGMNHDYLFYLYNSIEIIYRFVGSIEKKKSFIHLYRIFYILATSYCGL